MSKLKIKKRKVPLSFGGTYTRQDAPSLTNQAILGRSEEKENEGFDLLYRLDKLTEEELIDYYKENEGAWILFQYQIKDLLDQASFRTCDDGGFFISFDPFKFIELILALYPTREFYDEHASKIEGLDQKTHLSNILHSGLERMKRDNAILDYSMELGPPEAEHYWSIFLS